MFIFFDAAGKRVVPPGNRTSRMPNVHGGMHEILLLQGHKYHRNQFATVSTRQNPWDVLPQEIQTFHEQKVWQETQDYMNYKVYVRAACKNHTVDVLIL